MPTSIPEAGLAGREKNRLYCHSDQCDKIGLIIPNFLSTGSVNGKVASEKPVLMEIFLH
jgi:hypothetical protein